jgi:translocation and assembly module TamB
MHRVLLRASLAPLALMLLLAALLAAVLATDRGFAGLLQIATALSGEQIRSEAVRGNPWQGLQIGTLRIESAKTRIAVQGLRVSALRFSLAQAQLRIDTLRIDTLEIETLTQDPRPPQLPGSLDLPFKLQIDAFSLRQLTLLTPGKPTPLRLGPIAARLDGSRTWRLQLRRLSSPWGDLHGQLTLAKTRPYAIDGNFSAQVSPRVDEAIRRASATPPSDVQLRLTGTLEALAVTLDLQGDDAQRAKLAARLAPFDPQLPLRSLTLHARNLDPARLLAGAPQARLDIDAQADSQAGSTVNDLQLKGSSHLTNHAPGALDAGGLPLRTLALTYAGSLAKGKTASLTLDFGAAGRAEGEASWQAGRAQLQLAIQRLDLHALHRQLTRSQLRGTLQTQGDLKNATLQLALTDGRMAGQLDARLAGTLLDVRMLTLRSSGARLAARGRVELADRRFSLEGDLTALDLSRFGAFPASRLNGNFAASGSAAPLSLNARYRLSDSQLRGAALAGEGRFTLAPQRLSAAVLSLQLGNNRLVARGALGRPGDRLSLDLDARELQLIGPGFAGSLNARGWLAGSWKQPSADLTAQAHGLQLPGMLSLTQARLTAHLPDGLSGTLDARLLVDDARWQAQRLSRLDVSLKGHGADHRLNLAAQSPDLDLKASAQGAWLGSQGWQGRIDTLLNHGRYAFALTAPAPLAIAPDGNFRLSAARWQLARGSLDIALLEKSARGWNSRGRAQQLDLGVLDALLPGTRPYRTDLVVSGDWDASLGETLSGQLNLRRERGDLRLQSPDLALQLQDLRLALVAQAGTLSASVDLDSRLLGTLNAQASSALSWRDGRLGVAGDAPLQGRIKAVLNSLKPVIEPLSPALRVDGRLVLDLNASGSLAAPQLTGTLDGDGLLFAYPDQGISLDRGILHARFAGDKLLIRQFDYQGRQGSLRLAGEAQFAEQMPSASIRIVAEQLLAVTLPEREVQLSGRGQIDFSGDALTFSGDFKADRGRILLPDLDVPRLSDDVFVVGKSSPKTARPLRIGLDLAVDLGDKFTLKGRGADVQLNGKLRVQGDNAASPRVLGQINVTRGRYAAYGQRLDIDRGVARFNGAAGNPALDILALRKLPDVTVGVAITGSAQTPAVKLYSVPAMADEETLSWLVLGHGLERTTSAQDINLLQSAAAALLAQGGSVTLQAQIAQTLGLDSFSIDSDGTLANSVVSIGKQVSGRASIGFEQSVSGLSTLARLTYQLSRAWSIKATTGTENALDIFYTLKFD